MAKCVMRELQSRIIPAWLLLALSVASGCTSGPRSNADYYYTESPAKWIARVQLPSVTNISEGRIDLWDARIRKANGKWQFSIHQQKLVFHHIGDEQFDIVNETTNADCGIWEIKLGHDRRLYFSKIVQRKNKSKAPASSTNHLFFGRSPRSSFKSQVMAPFLWAVGLTNKWLEAGAKDPTNARAYDAAASNPFGCTQNP